MRQKPVDEPAAIVALSLGTPRRRSSLKRFFPFPHCRQRYERSLRRIHDSKFVSTRGVWQKPKYPFHPIMYGPRSSISFCRLIPRVRRVISRIFVLNLSSAFGAMRRLLPSFEMLNPRNFRSSGRATALFASLTLSLSLSVRNWLTVFAHLPPHSDSCLGSRKQLRRPPRLSERRVRLRGMDGSGWLREARLFLSLIHI